MAQVAVQAYKFNKEFGGEQDDPVIYEGLRNAYEVLDGSKQSLLSANYSETSALSQEGDTIYAATKNGIVSKFSLISGKGGFAFGVLYSSNPSFFSSSGKYLVDAKDDFIVYGIED